MEGWREALGWLSGSVKRQNRHQGAQQGAQQFSKAISFDQFSLLSY